MDAWVEVCQGGYQDEQVIRGTRPEEGDREGGRGGSGGGGRDRDRERDKKESRRD